MASPRSIGHTPKSGGVGQMPTEKGRFSSNGVPLILDVLRIASWILGTRVPLKKGPSATGLQTVPHSKTGTRALLGPCAHAFRCLHPKRAGALLGKDSHGTPLDDVRLDVSSSTRKGTGLWFWLEGFPFPGV